MLILISNIHQDEVMRFLVEVQSVSAVDPFCKTIMKHLEKASKKFLTDRKLRFLLSKIHVSIIFSLERNILVFDVTFILL